MPTPRIVVVGSTNTDMVADVPQLPQPGATVLGGAFRMTPGGKGANQAVAAARAGGAVTFITAVGDDTFGDESRRRFTAEGIDTRHIATKSGTPSGVALILVDAQGENMIAVAPGANALLSVDDISAAHDRGAFSGAALCLAQLEVPLESVLMACAIARQAGSTILLNPAPMPPNGLPEALLAYTDILTPNEGELRMLLPKARSLEDAARQVLTLGPQVLVVTQGRRGVTVFTRDASFSLPALSVETVDTVGAGDCFSATLGVALTDGRPLQDAIRFATTAAAISTTRVGAQSAMPTRQAIEAALQAGA